MSTHTLSAGGLSAAQRENTKARKKRSNKRCREEVKEDNRNKLRSRRRWRRRAEVAELFEGDEGKTGWRDDSWWSAEWWRTGHTDHKKQTKGRRKNTGGQRLPALHPAAATVMVRMKVMTV